MTDTPGREPEERLPAVRPAATPVPAERFTSPPSTRAVELSPERAAQVVRQSSNARWVGFLAVVIVILFVSIYWFYELGAPLGLTTPRVGTAGAELAAQQVTAVERGYNVYEANCARCHGEQGEGGLGPTLNRQDKLFAHLSENYLRTILTAGGRYACGNPASLMPVWSDEANPPGPLNYRQIEELIAFLRAPSNQSFIKRDEELLDPRVDPVTGEVETFTGWRDVDYKPAPDATPYPDCWSDEFAVASEAPGASIDPNAEVVTVVASGVQFTTTALSAPADTAFTMAFDNQDAAIPHDVVVSGTSGEVFRTAQFPGVETRSIPVEPLAAGEYTFVCSLHANMTGTLTVE